MTTNSASAYFPTVPANIRYASWITWLLPFIEQDAVFKTMRRTEKPTDPYGRPLQLFLCPSDARVDTVYDFTGIRPTTFYAGVASDPELLASYPEQDLEGAIQRLTGFLEQYWGGPGTYSEQRGHPRLRMRHGPFAIGPAERDAWLSHMYDAVTSLGLPEDLEKPLLDYLVNAAYGLTPDEVELMWATAPPRMPVGRPADAASV